ncbi:MAG: aminomethyl-transferring glycine dehydrogenase subunit GcvPB [Thermoleophilia bacterium]
MSGQSSDDVQARLQQIAHLRRDGGVVRDYSAPRWNEPLIMEQSVPGERGIMVPLAEEEVKSAVGDPLQYIPAGLRREMAPDLPELSQHQALRHYLRLSQMTLGMDLGSDISEGTCTMKYSPKLHEELVRYHKQADVHPWQDEDTMQGLLEIVYECGEYLKSIAGMDAITLQPGGGSHVVYTNACVMRAYFEERGELPQRNEMITTIFSHPCDAATPMVAGFKVITVMPDENGYPDLAAVKAAVSERTAGCMITNPEDTGIYNPRIDEYVRVIHDAGGLCFTDQANANGILGVARAREAGFDACHFNLHKTFSSPHGSEGPATGAYLCTDKLAPYLPVPLVTKLGEKFHLDYDRPQSIGRVRGFLGNWMGVVRAYAWIRNLGPEGLREVAEIAVINNNYLDKLLLGIRGVTRPYAQGHRRLDQVRYSLEQLQKDTGVGTEAVRDRMIDFGIQSFWMSHHPWVVPEPFTPEPCETYSRADLDEWAAVIRLVSDEAYANADSVLAGPQNQPIAKMKRLEALEDPKQWAFTWRAYKRKIKEEL